MSTGLDAQQQIFASNPDDRRAFEALEEHFFLAADWEALSRIYRDRLEAPSIQADPALRAPLLFRLGQILEERILDLDAAIEVYWVLARLDPTNRPALRQLRGIHERRESWDMVLQIAELESATTMPPFERASFESELGCIWARHLGDPEEARLCFERALASDPEAPTALEGLAGLHTDAGRIEEAAETLERLTRRLRGPERAPVWIALGTLYAGPLEEPDLARNAFATALEDDPFQSPAVEWSLLLATAAEDWEEVSELLERRFDLASGARHRAAIAVEASQIQLNHRGSNASARAWIDRAIELAPNEPSVLLASADVERADHDRDALLDILDRLVALAGRHAPRTALVEAAELHAELGDPDAALEAIRKAADRSGDNDGRILMLQAKLLRNAGAKRELAEVLETLTTLESGPDGFDRTAHLCELARLQEDDLGDPAAARTSWQRAFDLEPAGPEALTALERIHRKHDDWDNLRALFERALAAREDDPNAELAANLGLVLLEHFDETEPARALFEQALDTNDTCRSALDGLHQIADRSGDTALLLEICEREARHCNDPDRLEELARVAIPILEDRDAIGDALIWARRWSEKVPKALAALEKRADFELRLGQTEAEIESRRAIAKLQRGAERSDTLRRQAALHIELADPLAAASVLEAALEAAPESSETQIALCDAYRELGRSEDLARVLRTLVDALPPSEQAEPLEELATILHDDLGDIDTAIVVRWRLADLPDAPELACDRLEDLLERAGRYAELAHLLEDRRHRIGDESPEAFDLDLRRGRLLLDSLGQCEEAAAILSALHQRHPEDETILELFERALRTGDDAQGLCDLLERRADWETDASRKAPLDLERAGLLEDALGEPLRACDLYEEIARTHPDSDFGARATQRLETLLEANGQWTRLRSQLESTLDSLEGEARATAHERIAAICRDRLNDVAGRAAHLEAVSEWVQDRVHVWQQLKEIYAHELDRPGDWLRVVEAELETDLPTDREFSLRVSAARLCLDKERCPPDRSSEEAYAHYARVLELDPAHPEAAEVLALHFSSANRPDETARILENRLAHLPANAEADALDLRLRLATLHTEFLEDDERAQVHLEAAREILGAESRVAEPLAGIYERQADFEGLSRLSHDALMLLPEGPESLRWRLRLAASERGAGRPEEAATAYRAALVSSPDDREIEDALVEIYDELGEFEPLAELLEKRLPYAREDEMIELRLQLARIHSEGREEYGEALAHLECILAAHPQHRDAFDSALELAERVGDPARTIALLDRALELPRPSSERAAMLERRGILVADALQAPERAVANFREALSLDRDRPSTRRALREQLERLERWPAVLDCLFLEANEAEPARRLEILEEAAEIAGSRVSPDAALPWLSRLREERPEDPDLLARLAEVHRHAGRFEAALRALDGELALREEPDRRCALHVQRARLIERELHAPGRAIAAYLEALELTAEPEEILVELDRLYDLMGRPLDRAGILEARVAPLGGSEGLALRQTLASLYSVELARPELAIPHLLANVAATRHDPHEEMVHLGALDAALRAAAWRDAWVRAAERELHLIENVREIGESTPPEYERFLREELARTYDVEIGHPDRAIEHLRILASANETGHPNATRVGEQLRDLLRRTGRWAELAEHLSAHLQVDPGGTAAEWLELGRLREERLHDLTGARSAYEEAGSEATLRIAALRGQRRCSERLRDWSAMATALESELELENEIDRTTRTALARKLGWVRSHRLGDGERAAEAYEQALALDGKDREALQALLEVRQAAGAHAEVAALHRRELALLGSAGDDRHRAFEVWLRLANLLRDELDSAPEAIDAYRSAAELERLPAADELALARLLAATDATEEWFEVFGSWCDREDAPARVDDHIELSCALRSAGRNDAACARAERATALEPENAAPWALLGELHRDAESFESAAEAFERAAEHADALEAARYRIEAAHCIEPRDRERAHALLSRAIENDPASLAGHVALTRIAHALERDEETEREATIALELEPADPLDAETRLEIAVLGGRAARQRGRHDASRRLFSLALEIEAEHAEALEGVAEAHCEDGDYLAARPLLEARIELPGENPSRARHLTLIARGLEAEEHLDAAWARFEEAIELDGDLEEAHEGLVYNHERAARLDEALGALERWSQITQGKARGRAALRAAEHALALEDTARARTNLERATRIEPDLTEAWLMLCTLVGKQGPSDLTRRLCRDALDAVEPSELSAQISLQAARLAEVAGDTVEAIERYGEAARWDPRCVEAALCESRLTRMAGQWVEADGILARFIDAHPDPESPSLAHVHLERGRLLSGPLEGFSQAIDAYERALALQPRLGVARTALASLLLHAPDRWQDALAVHRDILAGSPTTVASLRALAGIAEQRGQPDITGGALSILRALGQASPDEASVARDVLRFAIHPGPPMADPDDERLRRIAHQLREELGSVLAEVETPVPVCEDAQVQRAIEQILAMEDEMTAPHLMRLEASERASLFEAVGGLFLDPGGNGAESRYRDALDHAVGRWTRRKTRRIVEETRLEAIEDTDHEAWGTELRAMAAAQVIDRNGGDLRAVLRALLWLEYEGDGAPFLEHAEIGTLAATSEAARRLLIRITTLLCERLQRGH